MITDMTYNTLINELEELEYKRIAGIEKIKKMEELGGKYTYQNLDKGEMVFCILEDGKQVNYTLPIEYQLVEELEEWVEDSINLYDYTFQSEDLHKSNINFQD